MGGIPLLHRHGKTTGIDTAVSRTHGGHPDCRYIVKELTGGAGHLELTIVDFGFSILDSIANFES